MTIPPCPCGQPETWKPIPGWEGLYDVSDHGQVRSLDHETVGKNGIRYPFRGRLLKATLNPREQRRQVKLHRDGAGTTRTVGPLVLLAFVGPRPDGQECCHNDGDSRNDRLTNLRWDTHSANVYDSVRHGTHWACWRTRRAS